jgi:hypothetical protein
MVIEETLGQAERGAGMTPVRLRQRSLLIPPDRHHQGGVGSVGVLPSHVVCTLQGVLPDE